MIYVLALLLSYGLCFGAMNKVSMVPPVTWLLQAGAKVELDADGDPFLTVTSSSRIKKFIREFFGQLFTCPYCMGFHTGWMSWLLIWQTTDHRLLYAGITDYSQWLAVGSWCLISAGSCYLVDSLALYLGEHR
mgnify:CR=1 FL=1